MGPNPVDRDTLKLLFIEHLRKEPKTQVGNVMEALKEALKRPLTAPETMATLELIHEFTVANIIMPAMDRWNAGWPWIGLTSHGHEVLSKQGPPVYDYEGYLRELRSRVPSLDAVVELFLGESLRAYQFNLYHTSMVMLGCASERAIRLLMSAYAAAIDKEQSRKQLESKLSGRDISKAYEEFKKSFDSTRSQIQPGQFAKEYDTHVDAVFTFIRLLRNSIVHAQEMPNITAAVVYSNLQQFSYYLETIYGLISYYNSHPVRV